MDMEHKKAFQKALGYLARRPRSILEMKDYLLRKQFSPLVVDDVVQRLCTEKYLNDRIFAENYLENRRRNKPKSLFALRCELKIKGIHPPISDELLAEYDDLEFAWLAVKPKIRSWQHLDQETFKKKVFNYLRYRGFCFAVIQSIWQQIFDSHIHPDLSKH
jgi:regulatory protein